MTNLTHIQVQLYMRILVCILICMKVIFFQIIRSDRRYRVLHEAHQNDWFLQISNVAPEDAGRYICQVATMQSAINRSISLNVPSVTKATPSSLPVDTQSTPSPTHHINQSLPDIFLQKLKEMMNILSERLSHILPTAK